MLLNTNPGEKIKLTAIQIPGSVKVSIIDNGIRIHEDSAEKIFKIEDSYLFNLRGP
ncbi:MAG: hypothetical protein ACFCUM_10780 [Bacteroidales bacterium]